MLSLFALTSFAQAPKKPKGKAPQPAVTAPQPAPAAAQEESPPLADVSDLVFKNLKWRSIGPATMGGRVADFAVDPKKPYTWFVAFGTGGLMKTTDNGVTWNGVFEKEAVASVGTVAVAPSDSKVVWAGTGEPNGRNSSSWGDGVYKSTDGGETWTNMGLRDSHNVARIVIDPNDPNIVYVAALGHLWGANKERGVYKTNDGGRTWNAVLQLSEDVGCIDLVMDSSDRNTLYAAMYFRRRTPSSFTSGGAVGGVYKTTDGGANWKKLTNGLPAQTGRIGLDVYRKDPKVVYALIESDAGGGASIEDAESKSGGVFRSEDKGETWQRVNKIVPRAFYFCQIRVDPTDDNRVYVLGFGLHTSDDGGKTFKSDGGKGYHGDLHAMWIDPNNSDHVLLGTDGGVYQSYSKMANWDFINNIAAGEFYRVTVDGSRPYRIAGGLQDNFNWVGPSQTSRPEGILNSDWVSLGGGDGFYCVFDPVDPEIVYAESQNGFAYRLNLKTGQTRDIQPKAKEGQPAFRFNWTSPLQASRHAAGTLYLGGNHLFKLTERGDKWEEISPDLSTQDAKKITVTGSGAETHCTIYTFSESPLKAGIIWAGTDDGKLWVTPDEGKTWNDLTANLPAEVKGLWVSRVEASHVEEGTAYVAIDGHRNDVFRPFVLVTNDFGKTWRSIAGNLPPGGPVKVVREDPVNRNLLYAGTEFSFWLSFNRGRTWIRLNNALPTVAVDDIVVHPRDRDLVIGTHGRSIFVLDDIRPLEEMTPEVMASDVHLFSLRPATEFYYLPESAVWSKRIFAAPNPPFGAYINYYLKSYTGEEVAITVADEKEKVVRKLTGPMTPGINRVVWDLKPEKEESEGPSGGQPKFVRPGEYTVTLVMGKKKLTQKVKVEAVEGLEVKD
ncbi:MAG TPA: hypothetical protein VFD58_11010 [Blastocatellia bacterium]|nr:hypothetical protein [Blastocatellia bacterium]